MRGTTLNKRVFLVVVLVLALFSFSAVDLFVEFADANPYEVPPPNSIIIQSDGSINGTDKITQSGNVYTLTGHITLKYKFIVIQKDNIILDGDGYAVTGDFSSGEFIAVGIYILGHSNITIQNFKLANFRAAIDVESSQQICIVNNTFERNHFGIEFNNNPSDLGYSAFCNNFIENTFDIAPTTGFSWDNGYVGNFWSNYTGLDSNGDGIGDTPYNIGSRDVDHFPLMAAVNTVSRPGPTIEPTPTSSAVMPTITPTQTTQIPDSTPQVTPTETAQIHPTPSVSNTVTVLPTLASSPMPTMQPTLTPTLTSMPENQQTAEPTQTQTADSNWEWLPIVLVSAVLLITAGAVVYLKKRPT
jgi:hypothetical protein